MSYTRNNIQKDQNGAAAMLTVIFITIILLVMTISFIRLSIIEDRLTGDGDLSSRAYYATESGLEEAKRAIRDFSKGTLDGTSLNGDSCLVPDGYDGVLSPPDRFDIEITCMLIDLDPASYEFNLSSPNTTVKAPLQAILSGTPPTDNFNEVRVKWHINANPTSDGDGELGGATGINLRPNADETSLLSVPEWSEVERFPAMLDIQFFKQPDGNFTEDDLSSYRVYANPTQAAPGPYTVFQGANTIGPEEGDIVPSNCEAAAAPGTFACEVIFRGFPDDSDYFIQITNLYRQANVEVSVWNGVNNKSFNGGQANVDVTARSGDVFRRVRATISLTEPSLLPDATITSSGSICKDFAITDNPLDFLGTAGTSCTLDTTLGP